MSDPNIPGGDAPQQPTTPLQPAHSAPAAPQQPAAPVPPTAGYPAAPGSVPPGGAPAYGAPAPVQPKGLAITALVLGIVSLVFCWLPVLGILAGIAAIVLGIIALKKAQSKGMSLTGLITGALGLVIATIILIVTLVFVGAVVQGTGDAIDQLEQATEEIEETLPETPSSEDATPSTEDESSTDEGTTASGGERSAEFCDAFIALSEQGNATSTGAEVPQEVKDLFKRLADVSSPNQAVYQDFYAYITNPTADTDISDLLEKYTDAAMADGMACAG